MYIYIYLHICIYIYIYTCIYINVHMYKPPDPINNVCPLSGMQISGKYSTYHSVKSLKYCAMDQILQDLILRARLRGTGFITQHG